MDADPLSQDLRKLASLDRSGLVRQWRTTFGTPTPKNLQAGLLSRLIAWQVQSNAIGSESSGSPAMPSANSISRRLKRKVRTVATPVLAPGSRLVREWQGITHHVLAVDGGFEHLGTRYRSLSAIAKAITGTQWSGPAFFGLKS